MPPFVTLAAPLAGKEPGGRLPLPPDEAHHLRTVLRLRDGAELEISDGVGRTAPAVLRGDHVEVSAAPTVHAPPSPSITVVHALPKGRKLDEVVRALVELGIDRIVPVIATHSVSRPEGDRAEKATERWRAIADSAVDQARRPFRCEVTVPRLLPEVLADLGSVSGVVGRVGSTTALRGVLSSRSWEGEICLAVGPEGGWAEEEVEAFVAAGLEPVSLGPTVLRTEHAAVVLASAASFALGRWEAPPTGREGPRTD